MKLVRWRHKIMAARAHLLLIPVAVRTYFRLRRLTTQTRLFCFFPFYQIGGSERVHADILEVLSARIPQQGVAIFFTKISKSETHKAFFDSVAECFDIAPLERSRYRQLLIRNIARAINKAEAPVVFGANATFFYEVIPFLKTSIKVVDLTHSFVPESTNPVERASLPCLDRLTSRVVISERVRQDYRELYRAEGLLNGERERRLCVVHNRIAYPRWDLANKSYTKVPFRVLFVGRNSAEKRIHLVGAVAAALRAEPIKFTLVGSGLVNSVAPEHHSLLTFSGEITDPTQLAEMYRQHHVILITSYREGFPLVLMEGMAHGAVPVSTRVGGIPDHIEHERNGLLVPDYGEEEKLVREIAACLLYLENNRMITAAMGQAAHNDVYRDFNPETFSRRWTELLATP